MRTPADRSSPGRCKQPSAVKPLDAMSRQERRNDFIMQVCNLFISPGQNFYGHHGQPVGECPNPDAAQIECVARRGILGDRGLDSEGGLGRDHLPYRSWSRRRLRPGCSRHVGGGLKNNVIFGSVNANKRHWYRAGQNLANSDREWLNRLITRREKPENFQQALARQPDDIKVVIHQRYIADKL